MFDSLVNEGWKANQCLPHGWSFKIVQKGQISFFTKDGVFMTTFVEATNYLKNSGKYSQEEVFL